MQVTRTTKSTIIGLAAGSIFAISQPVDGFGGGCSGGSTIEIHVETPGHNAPASAKHADILLQYVTWPDGTAIDEFVYVDAVRDVEYEGPTRKLRVVTGPDSEVGTPGVFDIEDGDGNAGSISTQDVTIFADRILNAWNHNNLNAYVDLRSSSHYSFTVDFESTIRDNSPLEDDVGELIIFEVSGNSIVQIEALDESGQVIGTPVIVGYGNEWKRIAPDRLYVGRYANNGSPRCGSFEYKATGVDLTDLGVMELNTLRISRPTDAGCSDVRADTRIVGVKTSIVPTAAMVFD